MDDPEADTFLPAVDSSIFEIADNKIIFERPVECSGIFHKLPHAAANLLPVQLYGSIIHRLITSGWFVCAARKSTGEKGQQDKIQYFHITMG